LKLGGAAILAEGILFNFRFWIPNTSVIETDSLPARWLHAPGVAILAILVALAIADLAVLGLYAAMRLRFALFHCLVHRSHDLRQAYRLYRKQAERYCIANLVVFALFAGLVLLIAGVALLLVFSVFTLRTPEGQYDVGVFLTLLFPALGFAFFALMSFVALEMVLHDFVLPHMAIENASIAEAWRAAWKRIRADRESFFSYFLLRVLLFLVPGSLLAGFCYLAMMPVFAALGMSVAGYNTLLEDATGIGAYLRIALNIVFMLMGIGIGSAAAAIFGGPFAVFLRGLSISFYGSRYPALGTLLEKAAPMQAKANVPSLRELAPIDRQS
jgi:hypothetical protein